jgi:hypothetical protein
MTSYMSYMIEFVSNLLVVKFSAAESQPLLAAILNSLKQSFEFDEDGMVANNTFFL